MSAFHELNEFLNEGESVEAIVVGPWGRGYGEPDPSPVPMELRGKVLTMDEAAPMMNSWSFDGDLGTPDCYAVHIWTDSRVIWVTQHDGSTWLESAQRNPPTVDLDVADWPGMPGG